MHTSPPAKLWTRDFILLIGSTLLLWTSFYFLLPTLPLYVVQRLRGSPAQVGLLSGLLTISAIFARPLAGYALDRWGRRWVQIAFLLLFCLSAGAYNLAQSLWTLFAVRLFHGIPFGGATTAGLTVAADLVPAARRGEGIGYYALAQTVAMAIGPALAFVVLGQGRFTWLFAVAAAIALGALVLAWWIRHPAIANSTTPLSLASILEGRVGWLSLAALFVAVSYSGIVTFITLHAAQLQIPYAGAFFSLYALGIVLARPGAGRIFDQRGPGLVVGVGLGLLCVAYFILGLWTTGTGFLCAAFVQGLGYGATVPSLQAMAVNLVPPARRGAANGTVFAAFDLGVGIGAYLLGAVAQAAHSYATMYLAAGGISFLPMLLFFGVVLPGYRRREE